MKTIHISFTPDPGYSGNYHILVYDSASPAIQIGQAQASGPFGSSVSIDVEDLPNASSYIVKWQTDSGKISGTATFAAGYNLVKSVFYTKNNCPSGQAGSTVKFTRIYTGVDQTAATAAATTDSSSFATAGQANANEKGACSNRIIPVPVALQAFLSGDPNRAVPAPSPYNNDYYSYLYKNLTTGHYVFSLYFNYLNDVKGSVSGDSDDCECGYQVANSINNYAPAKIGYIADPSLIPLSRINFTGTGYQGGAVSGYIDIDGGIYIDAHAAKAVCCYNSSVPTKYMMRVKYLTYASEFSVQGIFTT